MHVCDDSLEICTKQVDLVFLSIYNVIPDVTVFSWFFGIKDHTIRRVSHTETQVQEVR